MLRICFFQLGVARVLGGRLSGEWRERSREVFGGAETQVWDLARALRDMGWGVNIIVYDMGQRSIEIMDGIRFIKGPGCYLQEERSPLETTIKGPENVVRALALADGDVVVQRGGDVFSGLIWQQCRSTGSSYVLAIANDIEIRGRGKMMTKAAIRSAFKRAALLVAQTERQAAMVREAYGREALVIPNAAPDTKAQSKDQRPGPEGGPVLLWAGHNRKEKRLWLFLEAVDAARKKGLKARVVVAVPSSEGLDMEEMRGLKIELRTDLDRAGVMELMRSQDCVLVSTSSVEGFPNTFLEAWSCGRPVVTTFDPFGVEKDPRENAACLVVSGTSQEGLAEQLAVSMLDMVNDDRKRQAMGGVAMELASRYDHDTVVGLWVEALEALRRE